MPPACVMVICKKCGRGFPGGQIIPDPSKTKLSDQPIVVVTCPHCGRQDAYGPGDFQLTEIPVMDIQYLLDELCVGLGFCLPPNEQARLRDSPPASVDEFTDAVILAQGLDPVYGDKPLRIAVRSRVARLFEKVRED